MIKLLCNDILLLKTFNDLFEQKNLTNNLKHDKYFVEINIINTITNLEIKINGKKVTLKLPVNINHFFSSVLNIVTDVKVPVDNYLYYPYKRLLTNEIRKALLSDIQNIIFSNLVISNNGINKNTLYNLIWKKDKEISMNKLDTHLTNLKNQLKRELGLEINFQSSEKILKLLIN